MNKTFSLALIVALALPCSGRADVILASYDASGGLNGNFNTSSFDSVDTDVLTTATRLTQGGSLSGGGANAYVYTSALFSPSVSGSPGFNFGDVATATQSDAATAGDYFSFVLQSGGNAVTYTSLSFYSDQYGTSTKVDISYLVGSTETFVLQGYSPTGSNASVTAKNVDFADFATAQDVTWRFYLYGASDSAYGTRFDDITLSGSVTAVPEPAVTALFLGGLSGLGILLRCWWHRARSGR